MALALMFMLVPFLLVGCIFTSDDEPPPWYGQEPPPWYGKGPPCECEENNFILTISTEMLAWQINENFEVLVELRNESCQDFEIETFFLFYPDIIGEEWFFTRIYPPSPILRTMLESGGMLSEVVSINHYYDLNPGTYMLNFRAVFYLNWGLPDQRRIEILSNEIEINITHEDFILTISVEKELVSRGGGFWLNFELQNQSNLNFEITFFVLFLWHIEGWVLSVDVILPSYPIVYELKGGESRASSTFIHVEQDQEVGAYELKGFARFYLNWGLEDQREIALSNKLEIIVI